MNLITSDTAKTLYRLHVVTGDRRGAGTDANVYVIVHDAQGRTTPSLSLNKVFRNDNERGSTTSLDLKEDCGIAGPVVKVEVWRDNFADLSIFGSITEFFFGQRTKRGSSAWFLDRIEVEEIQEQQDEQKQQQQEELVTVHRGSSGGRKWVFPLQRWVEAHRHYHIHLHDCFLPQVDPNTERRENDIHTKRKEYKFDQKVENGPAQVTLAVPAPWSQPGGRGRSRLLGWRGKGRMERRGKIGLLRGLCGGKLTCPVCSCGDIIVYLLCIYFKLLHTHTHTHTHTHRTIIFIPRAHRLMIVFPNLE